MSNDDYKSTIKKLLQAQRRPLSTKRIATKTNMTWPTAKKYLNQMKKQGTLTAHKSSNRIFWQPKKKKDH